MQNIRPKHLRRQRLFADPVTNTLIDFKQRFNNNIQPWEAKSENQENDFSVQFLLDALDHFISEGIKLQRLCP